jgi:hypothetical protein
MASFQKSVADLWGGQEDSLGRLAATMVGRILDRLDLAQRKSLRAESALIAVHSVVSREMVSTRKAMGNLGV